MNLACRLGALLSLSLLVVSSANAGYWRLVGMDEVEPLQKSSSDGSRYSMQRCDHSETIDQPMLICSMLTTKSASLQSARSSSIQTLDPMPNVINPGQEFSFGMASSLGGRGKAFTSGSTGLGLKATVFVVQKDGKLDFLDPKRMFSVEPRRDASWPLNGLIVPTNMAKKITTGGVFTGGKWYANGMFRGGLNWRSTITAKISHEITGRDIVISFATSLIEGRIRYWYKWSE